MRFSGTIAAGDVRGDRSGQVLGALEGRLLQVFPSAIWLSDKSKPADVFLDVNVYSARTIDTRSYQERRNCRRWSAPGKDAKGALQRLISRSCLDWQVEQIPCLTRRYELDVQIRARQRLNERVLTSERQAFAGMERQCGDRTPTTAPLQAQVESDAAMWATRTLRASLAAVAPLTPVTTQQIAVNLDLNPREQILDRTENAELYKRLEEQRRQQEQALAIAEAKAAAEIAKVRAEAEALRNQPTEPRSTQAIAAVEDAHALVIGNSAYPGDNKLANPVNDAKAMSAKLRALGFKVTELSNANRDQMVRGLSEFTKTASRADLALLFYAGHGVQIQGVNYMIPVDMSLNDPTQATLQAVSLTQVVEQYLPGKTKLVFLDACRDNPLMAFGIRGITKGLAPINVSEGTLISYATKDGQVAEDGVGQANSPFTAALLEHLGDPDDIGIILRTVRSKVMQRTNNRQQPWEYGSLTGGALVLSAIKR